MKITIHKDKITKRIDFTVDGRHYHTNHNGYGLWEGTDYTKQIEGISQFSLRQATRSGMYKAIAKRYKEDTL